MIKERITAGQFIIDRSTMRNLISIKSTISFCSIIDSTLEYLKIEESYANIHLAKSPIALVQLSHCRISKLKIETGCKMEMYVDNSKLNLIELESLTLNRDSVVSFFNCRVYACQIEKFAMLGNLFFRQVQKLQDPFVWYKPDEDPDKPLSNADKNKLSELRTRYDEYLGGIIGTWKDEDGNVQLNITAPTFRIAQSSLGKTEFTDCDLGGFRFEFNNAKITEVFMSGGTIPEKGIIVYNGAEPDHAEKDPLRREEQKVSVYNQLKKVFEGQGDVYWATHFQAKTAEHQAEVLRIRRNGEKELFSTTFWDLFTFRLNALSNCHGESWGRAFGFTAVVAAFFYLLFLLSIGRLFRFDRPIDWNLVGQYVYYLDPTHKIDFIKGANLNVVSYFIDFFGRVLVGYGIYQFIAAFRKHGKK